MRITSLVILLILKLNHLSADPPEWSVDPNAFTQSINMTSQLYINDVLNADADNIIGVFVNDELRGFAQAQVFGSEAYYFLTVYSNTPSLDQLDFKVYVDSEDAIFEIEESLAYNEVNSSIIYELNSYLDIDQPISLSTIPGQTQVEGFPIDSIYLPDYLIQIDDDPIVWTYSSDPEITLSIIDDWLYIQPFEPDWTGTTMYTVTATEQTTNAYAATQSNSLTIIPDYGPPEWDNLDGQKIGKNQNFRTFDLDESTLPYGGTSLAYNYFMTQSMGVVPNENWSFSAKNFQYNMSVTARVSYGNTDHANIADRLLAYIDGELVGVTRPKIISGIPLYFLTVYSNVTNVEVELKVYDDEYDQLYTLPNTITFQNGAEYGTPDHPVSLNTAPLDLEINNDGTVVIDRILADWVGTQSIAFIAYDTFQPLINADTIFADFTVADEYAPQVSGIANQYIQQGGSFTLFDLDNHLQELDGEAITWSVSGDTNLSVTINSKNGVAISPLDPSWTGTENLTFRATDVSSCALYDEQTVSYTIGAPNQPPEILPVPEQVIGIGDTFPDLDLSAYLNEPNGDVVNWSYFFKEQELQASDPLWSINPGSFQFSMTMTVQVSVRKNYPAASGHQIAAFSDGQIRGLAAAQEVNGEWMFFLSVYANASNDSIYFQYYDPDQNAIYAVDDSIRFVSQQQLGTISDPYELFAGFVDPLEEDEVLQPKVVDKDWLGVDTLYAVATEAGTFERYKDTAIVVFRVQAESPVLPVDLISFTARKREQQSVLEWQIANPDQVLAYEIQRSVQVNGSVITNWENLGQLAHNPDQLWYQFIDNRPVIGKNYYRLKMIDLDGTFAFSELVNVSFDSNIQIKLDCYPNPSFGWITLRLISSSEEHIEISLIDQLGQAQLQLNADINIGNNALSLELDSLPAGTYYLKVTQGYRTSSIPLLLKRI